MDKSVDYHDVNASRHRAFLAWKACFQVMQDVKAEVSSLNDIISEYCDYDSHDDEEEGEAQNGLSPLGGQVPSKKAMLKEDLTKIVNRMEDMQRCAISGNDLELDDRMLWVGSRCGHLCNVADASVKDTEKRTPVCKKCGQHFRLPRPNRHL